MAAKMAGGKCDEGKRRFNNVLATPGRPNASPARKLKKGDIDQVNNSEIDEQERRIAALIEGILDAKLDSLAARLENMLNEKVKALESKFQNLEKEITDLKDDYNISLDHVERDLRTDINETWEYAVKNEQYTRKNNVQIHGLEENSDEDVEAKLIGMAMDELGVEIKPEEIEIAHRIGQARNNSSGTARSQGNPKPRSITVKFASNKTKMKLLTKRKLLKGKKIVIVEDMATDIAKRLKKLKEKASTESAWFVNGKIKYIQRGDSRIMLLRNWDELMNIE